MSVCTSYTFDVPGTPRPKGRPRVTSRGTYTPAHTREWEKAVGVAGYLAGLRPVEGPCMVQIWLRGSLRGDLDNYTKAILDGLNKVAYLDDRQVRRIEVWGLKGRESLCRVRVTRLGEGWEQGVEMPEVGREA
jgi:crossover junction endodeoxyribonuclease RusA